MIAHPLITDAHSAFYAAYLSDIPTLTIMWNHIRFFSFLKTSFENVFAESFLSAEKKKMWGYGSSGEQFRNYPNERSPV